MRIIVLLIMLGLTLSMQAQKKSSKEYDAIAIQYFLPKVSFAVKVEMRCTKNIPGMFAKQAKEYLGVTSNITEYSETWEIANIEINPMYLPDEKAKFDYPLQGSYAAARLSLTPSNVLVGVGFGKDVEVAERPLSFQYESGKINADDYQNSTIYNPLVEVLDSNFTTVEIDGVSKKVWDPIVRYEPKTLEDLLNESIKAIYRLRADRQKILAQETELPDGKSMEVLLAALDKAENEYLALFMGKTEQRTVVREFWCTPTKDALQQTLFHFSEKSGVAASEKEGEAYMLNVDNLVIATSAGDSLSNAQTLKYRVPATADVHLLRGNQEMNRFKAVIPQLGVIKEFSLDAIMNESLMIELHPQYGSLKYIGKKE